MPFGRGERLPKGIIKVGEESVQGNNTSEVRRKSAKLRPETVLLPSEGRADFLSGVAHFWK